MERAFVHVDYVSRCYPEHKMERELLQNTASVNDVDGVITGAVLGMNQNNVSDDKDDDNGDDDNDTSDDGQSGGGGSEGGSGESDWTVKYRGNEGIEDPLLPPV